MADHWLRFVRSPGYRTDRRSSDSVFWDLRFAEPGIEINSCGSLSANLGRDDHTPLEALEP